MEYLEQLSVANFAGIKTAKFELSRINIFIGRQASGKSVCAKLFYYFKQSIYNIPDYIFRELNKYQIRETCTKQFLKYFPPENWGNEDFRIHYDCGNLAISISRKSPTSSTINIAFSKGFDEILSSSRKAYRKPENESTTSKYRATFNYVYDAFITKYNASLVNNNYYIPAGRSYFATIRRNVFAFLSHEVDMDPFLLEFGRSYESMRTTAPQDTEQEVQTGELLLPHINKLICGEYKVINDKEYIRSSNSRMVAVKNCSSGQQEVLPLALSLSGLATQKPQSNWSTLFIEEPEAHLYPDAQREVVHLLSTYNNATSAFTPSQLIITTHSPYILSALNNLMLGGQIMQKSNEKSSKIVEVLGKTPVVNPDVVRAYNFLDSSVSSIIDNETCLIKADLMDNISNALANEFEALIDIAFEVGEN